MKKVTAILLTLIIAFSLVACSNSNAAQVSPSAAPSGTAPATESSTAPAASAGTVGYITDEVDHNARKTYKIAYFYFAAMTLEKLHFQAMQNMQKKLNITVTDINANSDGDAFINNFEVAATQGYDGFVVEPNADVYDRTYEVLNELKIPYIYTVNAYRDENGANLVPTVILDQYKNGNTQVQWFFDHYKDYWKDVPASEIVLMTLEYSTNPDLISRIDGVKDKFTELFPGNQIIVGDMAGQQLNEQVAYDQCAAIITAHPEVKYWFIDGCVENFGQGAARATEALGKTDTTLIVTSGANVLPIEWDSGYKGNWVASYAVFNYNYVVPALTGLIALIDGRATFDSLWKESRKEGDKATAFIAGDQMVTVDTYKDVQTKIESQYGAEASK